MNKMVMMVTHTKTTKQVHNYIYHISFNRAYSESLVNGYFNLGRVVSLWEMGDYKTTRLLVCCALDRIWSSTQRLEDLDWFGPEMPYVQYGGWCSCSIALEPGCLKF